MPSFTPVQPTRGGRVHALLTSNGDATTLTACRRRPNGWRVAIDAVNCRVCLARIGE